MSLIDRTVNSVRNMSSQNVDLFRLQITLKAVDQRIFQLFSGLAEKVVWRLLVRLCADYFVLYDYQGRVRTVVAELTTGRTTSSLLTYPTNLCRIQSTCRRHWPVADVTALTPCRRFWPVAASTVCRHPVATPRFIRCRADTADNSSLTTTTSQSRHRDARSLFGYAAHF